MQEIIRKMWRDDDGQDLIEYALIAGFIALACVAAITLVGTDLNSVWNTLQTNLSSAAGQ